MAKATFTDQQKKSLILIVLVLAAIRFIGLPFIDQQAQQKAELEMTTQQLERALRLLRSDIDEAQVAQLQQQLSTAEQQFLPHSSNSEFRLQAQRQIQQISSAAGAQVDLFDWLTEQELVPGYLHSHQARIILKGEAVQLVQAQLAMQEQLYGLQVLEFAMQEQRAASYGNPAARLTLLVAVAGVQVGPVNAEAPL